jgi:glucose/arabinose dehydrogenase
MSRSVELRFILPCAMLSSLLLPGAGVASAQVHTPGACPASAAGITLPAGFCATIFADSLPAPRHMAVAANGDLFVASRAPEGRGGVIALRDTDGDGRADVQERFATGFAATEVALHGGFLYTETGTAILRYPLRAGELAPFGAPDTVAKDLPGRGHSAKAFAIDSSGTMYVNIGSLSNACQERDRQAGSPGVDPCVELETRAGV